MPRSEARRIAVPDELQPRAAGDDASAFELPIGERRFLTPEQWARATFEGAPRLLGIFLAFGWRFVLGLRLGDKRSPHSIAGWRIAGSGPDSVTLEARSRLLEARHTVVVRGSVVMVVTVVHFERRLGRALWAAAAPIHFRTIPYLLTGAGR